MGLEIRKMKLVKSLNKTLRELQSEILGTEMNLNIAANDLEVCKTTLSFLEKLQTDLEYNIQLHKTDGTVSVAKEYRKSVYQLGMVKDKIKQVNIDIAKFEVEIDKLQKSVDELMKKYEYMYENSDTLNVIPFKRKSNDT